VNTSTPDPELDLSRAPLLAHLIELRKRLLYCLGFFVVAFAVAYHFSEAIYAFLLTPLIDAFGENSGRRMIYTGLHEAFFTYLRLSLFTAIFFTLPLALNQLWKFLAPGLYTNERRSMGPLFVMTPVMFVAGSALAFYVVFPLAWRFFLGFETSPTETGIAVELEARVGEYLALVTKLILAFGLSFELPVLLLVLAKVGMVTADGLRAHRKHAVVATFAVAALITPPDIISQVALGTPVLLLYELSIFLITWTDADAEGVRRARIKAQNS